MIRHLVIPDTQIRPGVSTVHINWIAQYIVDMKPDKIIMIGDWADMASLSSYDIGKKSFEGRNYRDDIDVANEALERLVFPIKVETERTYKQHLKRWEPELHYTIGNHENRIDRAIETDRKLEGLISTDDLKFKEWGFKVHPFLKPVVVDGIAYCHYFCSGVMGRPINTAKQLLAKKHMSCVAGHLQGYDVSTDYRGDGTRITSIIAGSAYLHDEGYLNDQTNHHWRGVIVLNEVSNGTFDEMKVSLNFLQERYS